MATLPKEDVSGRGESGYIRLTTLPTAGDILTIDVPARRSRKRYQFGPGPLLPGNDVLVPIPSVNSNNRASELFAAIKAAQGAAVAAIDFTGGAGAGAISLRAVKGALVLTTTSVGNTIKVQTHGDAIPSAVKYRTYRHVVTADDITATFVTLPCDLTHINFAAASTPRREAGGTTEAIGANGGVGSIIPGDTETRGRTVDMGWASATATAPANFNISTGPGTGLVAGDAIDVFVCGY